MPAAAPANHLRLQNLYFWVYSYVGILGPFLGPYLRSLGLDGRAIGVLGAITPIATALIPPLWGAIGDRLGEVTTPLRIALTGAFLAFLPLPFVSTFWPLFVTWTLFAVFRSGTGALMESLTFTMLEQRGGLYGRIRLWGSVGFLAASAVVAIVADLVDDPRVFAVGLVLTQLLAAGSAWALPKVPRERSVDFFGDLRELLRNRAFVMLLAVTCLSRMAEAAPLLFYPTWLKDQGAPSWYIALFWATGVLAEVVLFRLAPQLVAWARIDRVYLVSIALIAVRYGAMLVVHDRTAVALIQTLHAFTFAAFYFCGVTTVAKMVPLRLRATGQALFSALGFGLAIGVSNVLGGLVFERFHIEGVLMGSVILGLISTVAAIPTARALRAA